jgi:hypothetical protein
MNGVGNNCNSNSNPCRISPSPNHMAVLEFIYGLTATVPRVVRQLRWNVACSEDTDPWFDGTYYEGEDNADDSEDVADGAAAVSSGFHRGNNRRGNRSNGSNNNGAMMRNLSLDENKVTLAVPLPPLPPMSASTMPRRKKPAHGRNDGRYIPIDALTAVRSSIPNHSPILTNFKRRLPTRSDMGFARPTPEEVRSKMDEVRREAEWEEASPRIVLLASGFLLFEQGGDVEEMNDITIDKLHPSCRKDAMLWAGDAVPGVPFAGRDLVMAYKKTIMMSSAKNDDNYVGHDNHVSKTEMDQSLVKNPRSYSVFAPPVDAIYSPTHLWRPRPFMDRPPGHIYFLACPLDLQLEEGDTEPLFCTMALYSLPPQQQHEEKIAEDNSPTDPDRTTFFDSVFRGKISEDFFFPAGDWNLIEGFEREGGCQKYVDHDDEERPQQSWRRRKRRAIMSFDPLDISPSDLHLVATAVTLD